MLWDSTHSGQQRTRVLCCDVPHHENIPIMCGADAVDVEDEPSWCRDRYLMAAPSHPPVPWAGMSVCRWHCPPPKARRGRGRAPHPPLSSRTHPRRKSAARRGADTPKDLAWRLRHNCTQWHGEGECCCCCCFFSVLGWMCMLRSHHASRVDRCISEGSWCWSQTGARCVIAHAMPSAGSVVFCLCWSLRNVRFMRR